LTARFRPYEDHVPQADGSAFLDTPALFVKSDSNDRPGYHEARKRWKQDVVEAQGKQADDGDDRHQKYEHPVTDAGRRLVLEIAPAGREPAQRGGGSDVSLPGVLSRQRRNNGRYRRHHRSPCTIIAARTMIVPH
jgi:hypothetical protein